MTGERVRVVVLAGVLVALGCWPARAQLLPSLPGMSVGVPIIATPGVTAAGISIPPIIVSGTGVSLPATGLPVIAIPTVTLPAVNVPSISVAIPGVATVTLPSATVPSLNVLNIVGIPPGLNLPADVSALLINLPGVSVVAPGSAPLAVASSNGLGGVLNQVVPVNQQLAASAAASLLGPVEQLLDGLAAGDGMTNARAIEIATVSGSAAPSGVPNVWMWNAVTAGRGQHDGLKYRSDADSSLATGSTLPVRSVDKAMLPGLLWDASTFFGVRKGMLHFGITGGVAQSDIEIGSSAALADAGIAQAGSASFTSHSIGGFAIVTTGTWYAGATAGGSWGRSEVENYLLEATSDYRTSSFIASSLLGTILPITNIIRFDARGSLAYQRTIGDSHLDTLGIVYGEHAIESVHGSLSGRLFGTVRLGNTTVRPYAQAGLAHRFHYANELRIQGIDFAFDDAGTSLFAAAGIDLEIGSSLQLSAGARQDHSRDFDSLSARFGIALRLN